jgi:opacity protein-like surface antigen
MRKYLLLAAVAAAAVVSPAYARDNSPYVGVEGGALLPGDTNVDVDALFPTTTVPGVPSGLNRYDDALNVDYKTGYDVDLIGGYDFGMFRLEAELGYKRAGIDDIGLDDSFLTAVNAALEIDPALTNDDLSFGGHVSVLSGMANAMFDFGDDAGWSGFLGAGAGLARVKVLGDSDSGFAWQAIAGVRMAISENIDLGLKYRYFRTKKLDFSDTLDFGAAGVVPFDARGRFESHSFLLSLVYNL